MFYSFSFLHNKMKSCVLTCNAIYFLLCFTSFTISIDLKCPKCSSLFFSRYLLATPFIQTLHTGLPACNSHCIYRTPVLGSCICSCVYACSSQWKISQVTTGGRTHLQITIVRTKIGGAGLGCRAENAHAVAAARANDYAHYWIIYMYVSIHLWFHKYKQFNYAVIPHGLSRDAWWP